MYSLSYTFASREHRRHRISVSVRIMWSVTQPDAHHPGNLTKRARQLWLVNLFTMHFQILRAATWSRSLWGLNPEIWSRHNFAEIRLALKVFIFFFPQLEAAQEHGEMDSKILIWIFHGRDYFGRKLFINNSNHNQTKLYTKCNVLHISTSKCKHNAVIYYQHNIDWFCIGA